MIHNFVVFFWIYSAFYILLLGAKIDDFIHSLEQQNIALEVDAFGTRNGTEDSQYNGAIILSGDEKVRASPGHRAMAIIGQSDEKWHLRYCIQITYLCIYFVFEERIWAKIIPFKL